MQSSPLLVSRECTLASLSKHSLNDVQVTPLWLLRFDLAIKINTFFVCPEAMLLIMAFFSSSRSSNSHKDFEIEQRDFRTGFFTSLSPRFVEILQSRIDDLAIKLTGDRSLP